ncbi:MAG TPA: hypothetical protein VHW24_09700 [Bryobacteraceae bacterium]|jgi:hypothetical protein|nr:hypothetical protein [Bryobacteraceae bacterium]
MVHAARSSFTRISALLLSLSVAALGVWSQPSAPQKGAATIPTGQFHDAETGTEFTLPGDWTVTSHGHSPEGGQQIGLAFKDAPAEGFVWMKSQSIPQADIIERLRSQVDFKAAQRKGVPGYKMLRDTAERRFVGGQPALSIQAEYTEGAVRKIEYHVWVITENTHVYVASRSAASDFPKVKASIDRFLATFHVE